MRKLLYVAALFSLSVNVYAQDEETTDVLTTEEETVAAAPNLSKNGKQLTPVAGDIGLGMDAGPFLQYLGNSFNGENFNAEPTVQGINNTISVKYFLADDMAARVRLNVDQTVTTDRDYVIQDKQTDQSVQVADHRITENSGWDFAAGIEMRRGSGRIQGYYGGEVTFGRSNFDRIYEYGNSMTVDNQEPTTSGVGVTAGNFERLLADYGGTTISFGLNGLIGVEYFFAPKISLGGEMSMGPSYFVRTDGTESWEYYGDDGREIRTDTDNGFNQKVRGWNTNTFGNIFAHFYF